MTQHSSLVVPPDASGLRLDAWLTAQLTGVSRARVQLMLSQEQVQVNGKAAKASLKLRGGESIAILGEPEPPPLRAISEDIPLNIVYEDADLSVINKPAGMMVHAGAGGTDEDRNRGTLVNALLHHYGQLSTVGGPTRPGIVHRLDKQTSGLIVVARNDQIHRQLSEMFAHRLMKKTYFALVHGEIKKSVGSIDLAISRDAIRRTRMTTRRIGSPGTPGGPRAALSHYTVERRIQSRYGAFTLVRVRIETGRTHQIRVHLSSIGHAVVGDTLYGAPARLVQPPNQAKPIRLERNFLHAAELAFTHPRTGEVLHLSAPLPEELAGFLRQIEMEPA
ncbi:MAG: RluA family pseudouridine synthase [Acidobacteria bacterium]|nr:RluA family pseudouridine synthase [Acidobacteriota bacterium]MBW4044410.1 RluA family pseudouridine synthase [Acidobacteriota bacterium]